MTKKNETKKYRNATQEEVDEFNVAFNKFQEELKCRTVISVYFNDEGRLEKSLVVLKEQD